MASANTLTPERELWAVALWVGKHHGDDGHNFIARQMDRLLAEGDLDDVGMWRDVGARFEALKQGEIRGL